MASGFANPLAATMASTVTPNWPAMYDRVSPCWMVYVCSPIGAVVVVAITPSGVVGATVTCVPSMGSESRAESAPPPHADRNTTAGNVTRAKERFITPHSVGANDAFATWRIRQVMRSVTYRANDSSSILAALSMGAAANEATASSRRRRITDSISSKAPQSTIAC